MAAGDLFAYLLLVTGDVNREIRKHLPIIEDRLVELISPTRQSFTLEQLVKDHGYPDVDLDEIDEDWF